MKKRLLPLLLLIILVFNGCGADVNAKPQKDNDGKTKTDYSFMFVCPILENEYWKTCIEGVKKADEELGTHTEIIGPATAQDFSKDFASYMKTAIKKKPDGIIAFAGKDDVPPLIEESTQKGIPVLAIDTDAPTSSRVAFVGTDAYNSGYEAGESLVRLTDGNAKVGIIVSSKAKDKEIQIVNAFKDAIYDYKIDVVTIYEANYNGDSAEEKTRQMLKDHPDISALFVTTGYNVTGAAKVKKELGRNDLILIGFDDIEENLEFVREGIVDMIIVQRVEQLGYNGVYLMKEYVDQGYLAKDSYDTGVIIVDINNVDTYKSGSTEINKTNKTVRVGYYESNAAFQAGVAEDNRKSGYAYEYYQNIASITGWKYEYYYGSRSKIIEMLKRGEIDITAGIYKTEESSKDMLLSTLDMEISGEKRYFAVNKNQTELLHELNSTLEYIRQYSPNFTNRLNQKYYPQSTQEMLSPSEREWIDNKIKIKIGYVKNNLPYSDIDSEGNPTGIIKDMVKKLSDFIRIPIVPVCYDNITALEKGLTDREIDIAFPIYSDLWISESKGFLQTNSFISDRVMLLYSGDYSTDILDTVALNEDGMGHYNYLNIYSPSSTINYYPSRKDLLEAVYKGRERCTIGCSSILQRFMDENPKYYDLNIAYLDNSVNFGMSVNNDDCVLLGILNRAISQISTAAITSNMIKYSSVDKEFTFKDFIRKYSAPVLMFVSVILCLFVIIFVMYFRKTNAFRIEQAKTNAALHKAVKAANSASEAKTNFLSSMSHDIRTPMNAIIGMTSIAQKNIKDTERVENCLDKIEISSRHLLTLINNILDISKIESGELVLNPTVFSLRETINTLIDIVRPNIQSKNIDFDVRIHNMEHEYLYADEVRINQIFINILSNAVKYTPNNGSVILDLFEEMSDDNEKVRLIYVVKDTGIGMSQEYMKDMYNIFSREKDSRINKIQGTGLGLAIVKQMVDLMNGKIDCESELEKGTKFTITLELPYKNLDGETEYDVAGKKILLVDDDEIFLECTDSILRDMGTDVVTATGGKEAIEIVRDDAQNNSLCDMAIVDWKMPDMNGIETIREIRKITGPDVPIILASAYDWSNIEKDASEVGINGFINKPLFKSYLYEQFDKFFTTFKDRSTGKNSGLNDSAILSGKRLIVAEDNELNWEVISELLSMYGIVCERAPNGNVCVDMLSTSPEGYYDLILMDIQMPIMNGREAAKLIRKSSSSYVRNIPIIAMTADAFAEDVKASLESGMNGHVSKPVDIENLLQEIRKYI